MFFDAYEKNELSAQHQSVQRRLQMPQRPQQDLNQLNNKQAARKRSITSTFRKSCHFEGTIFFPTPFEKSLKAQSERRSADSTERQQDSKEFREALMHDSASVLARFMVAITGYSQNHVETDAYIVIRSSKKN
jgi:hypothetical protein